MSSPEYAGYGHLFQTGGSSEAVHELTQLGGKVATFNPFKTRIFFSHPWQFEDLKIVTRLPHRTSITIRGGWETPE